MYEQASRLLVLPGNWLSWVMDSVSGFNALLVHAKICLLGVCRVVNFI